jgi:hypothetical protein
MSPFFPLSFNLIFLFSQSLYFFYIESLQKLDIIVMPLAQELDAIMMPLCEEDTWAQGFNACV